MPGLTLLSWRSVLRVCGTVTVCGNWHLYVCKFHSCTQRNPHGPPWWLEREKQTHTHYASLSTVFKIQCKSQKHRPSYIIESIFKIWSFILITHSHTTGNTTVGFKAQLCNIPQAHPNILFLCRSKWDQSCSY